MLKTRLSPIIIICSTIHAFLFSEEIIDLDPVQSLPASILEESIVDTYGRVDLLSADILDSLKPGDLTAALRRVPGVTISRYNPVGAYGGSDGGGIFIRGHGSGRPGADISTMIDGIPLFVGVWTHPLIDTLSVDMADSIEVIKSPQPVRVGNMGFGAINIIPQMAQINGSHGEFEASYGSFNTILYRGEYAYRNDQTGFVVSASHRESDGHRMNADGEVDAFYSHMNHAFSEHLVTSFLFSFTDSWAHDPEPVHVRLPIIERYDTKNRFLLGKVNYEAEKWQLEMKYHLEMGQGNWLQWHEPPPPPFPAQSLISKTKYKNQSFRTKFSSNEESAESLFWSAGVNWERYGGRVIESYEVAPENVFENRYFELISSYLHLNKNIRVGSDGNNFRLSGGFRHLQHSEFDDSLIGEANLLWDVHWGQLYFQYANSTNYPGIFTTVFGRRGEPWQVGDDWKNLDSEKIQHYEVGGKWVPNQFFNLDLSLFIDESKDSVRFVAPPPSGYIINFGEYQTEGLEVMIHLRQKYWSVFSGITLMHSGDDIPNTPESSATIGFHYHQRHWRFSSDIQFVDSQYVYNPRFDENVQEVQAYELMSARLSYFVEFMESEWEYYLSVENLLNETYEYRPEYPMPKFSSMFGIRVRW